jgi:hypothetical protein
MSTLSLLDQPPLDDQPAGSELLPAPAGWPASPDRAVYHELLGEIVHTIAPHTERPGRDPHPAARQLRRHRRRPRLLPGRSDPPSPQRIHVPGG